MKEIWKPVPQWEDLYEVSSFGRIKSLRRGIILKPNQPGRGKNQSGYSHVVLNRNGFKQSVHVHKLVAQVFVPNPVSLPQVKHIDGNKRNNNSYNLKWATQQDCISNAIKLGNIDPRGENSGLSKYTTETIKLIRKGFNQGLSKKELSIKYGMSWSNIHRIINREIWSHI